MKQWTTKNNTDIYRLGMSGCSCYAAGRGSGYVLIDTGVPQERKLIESQFEDLGIEGLKAIIITHAHADHVGNAAYFQGKYECPIYIRTEEYHCLIDGYCRLPKATNLLTKLVTGIPRMSSSMTRFAPCAEVFELTDEITIPGFEGSLKWIATPGHSAGSVSIIIDDEIAVVGDAMAHGKNNRIYPPFADDERLIRPSWEKLLAADCEIFLPVHGNEIDRQTVLENLRGF
jgi:hydroxyacylglutathione hydrolase